MFQSLGFISQLIVIAGGILGLGYTMNECIYIVSMLEKMIKKNLQELW